MKKFFQSGDWTLVKNTKSRKKKNNPEPRMLSQIMVRYGFPLAVTRLFIFCSAFFEPIESIIWRLEEVRVFFWPKTGSEEVPNK
jgi:hypothetical protein